MNGWLFLAISTLICLGVFLNGVRFARATKHPLAGRRLFGMPVQGSDQPVERFRRTGRLLMIAAPFIWLVTAAICFGLFGPVDGMSVIEI